jgi:hypothetical protein
VLVDDPEVELAGVDLDAGVAPGAPVVRGAAVAVVDLMLPWAGPLEIVFAPPAPPPVGCVPPSGDGVVPLSAWPGGPFPFWPCALQIGPDESTSTCAGNVEVPPLPAASSTVTRAVNVPVLP